DVVFHPGVDDVRADGVAQERADHPGRAWLADRIQGRLAQPGIVACERTKEPCRLLVKFVRDPTEERSHDLRLAGTSLDGEPRDGGRCTDGRIVVARHRAVAPGPADREAIDGVAL